jgi:hypothetical protein
LGEFPDEEVCRVSQTELVFALVGLALTAIPWGLQLLGIPVPRSIGLIMVPGGVACLVLAAALIAQTVFGLRFQWPVRKAEHHHNSDAVAQIQKSTRIDGGYVYSHSNEPDSNNPWGEWDFRISDVLMFVGVQRRIRFHRSFENVPNILPSFALRDFIPLDIVMRKAGYKITDQQETLLLHEIHEGTSVAEITPNDFVLRYGIVVPVPCGDHLVKYLNKRVPDSDRVKYALGMRQLDPKTLPNRLTPQEKWMVNFWITAGTVKITWIAFTN